jgi:ubiquinone/menaquinone biosynthesis C-methylase UbiE
VATDGDKDQVRAHYGTEPLVERVEQALADAGLGGEVAPSELASLDQFHVGGIAAARQLADALAAEAAASVLDLGSGLGGPARLLAAEHGCRVSGVDLSDRFVAVARLLTERTGLSDRVEFSQGDVTALDFADDSFDHAWSLHVAMNIADREAFYGEARRVIKRGGHFAVYDVVERDRRPLTFPLPWSSTPETSCLLSAAATREALDRAGFGEISFEDQTEQALAWFAGSQAATPPAANTLGAGLATVMGPDFPTMGLNLRDNLLDGRVGLVQLVVAA